ncbi:MAG: YbaB/EbfC family nucleoid-associated protein [Rubripirellula sp.]|jgi:hypothetical protein
MFKGLGNLGNIASMVGALQQLPEKMQELNERMKSERVSASSGCGTVRVSMNGVGHVEEVKIEGDLTGDDLEHAIRDATNAAGAAAKQLYGEAMSQMARDMDLNLPGIDNILNNLTGGS